MSSMQWLQFMLSYIVQASMLLGVAGGLERCVSAARTKNRIWTTCFVCLIALLAVGLLVPRYQWIYPWSTMERQELMRAR